MTTPAENQVVAKDRDHPGQGLEPDPFGKPMFDHRPGGLADACPFAERRLGIHPDVMRRSELVSEVDDDVLDRGRLISKAIRHASISTCRAFVRPIRASPSTHRDRPTAIVGRVRRGPGIARRRSPHDLRSFAPPASDYNRDHY
jgi:hypothetical protein